MHRRKNLLLAISLLLVIPIFVKAESYDAYVDAGYSGEEDGSQSKPFNTISEAMKAGAKKVLVKSGSYDEKVIAGKEAKIYGESKNKVLLTGGIEMDDNSSLKNVTVIGGEKAVAIYPDASAEISDCNIKNFGKIGIDAMAGGGRITVKNSNISGGTGKGMYIELGRKIELSGNNVYENGEEGIDVRAKVSGFIKNNDIYDNGESGIEIIVGSSDVLISGNNIRKNGASGIASQFYKETKKTGELNIKNNTITKNKKYGLDCNAPSGGSPGGSYWNESINLVDNDMEDNKKSSINKFCKIIDAVDENEEDVLNKTDEKTDEEEPILEENIEKNSEDALADEEVERDEAIWENAESLGNYQETIEPKIKEQMEIIDSRGKLKVFFFGIDSESLDFIRKEIEISDNQFTILKNDLNQVKNEEAKAGIQSLIEKMENQRESWKDFVSRKENEKGVWNWFLRLLKIR